MQIQLPNYVSTYTGGQEKEKEKEKEENWDRGKRRKKYTQFNLVIRAEEI